MNKTFLLICFMLLLAIKTAAQSSNPSITPASPKPKTKEDLFKDMPQDMNMPEEMRVRMAIERADNEHRKVLADVDKLNELSTEVAKSFQERGSLSADEMKKLGAIEKLAKSILSKSGGEEVDDKTGRIEKMTVADAVNNINTAAAAIKKTMTTETRHVVSAAVIESSNDIINIAQFLRHAHKSN